MIYIIIGMDKTSGNEWVEHETFEKSLPAAERCQVLNTFNNNAVYRVDTVEPHGELEALIKAKLNEAYGKPEDWKNPLETFKQNQLGTYTDTDSMTVQGEPYDQDYTLTELFGMYAPIPPSGEETTQPLICSVCGALVGVPDRHLTFHNNLLP